ncbi:unnamed protein product [Chrysoparadoxa australica]
MPMTEADQEEDETGVGMELEHAIGYQGIPGGLFFHPNGADIVYSSGANVVIGSLTDPHEQVILDGHDSKVTCLSLSKAGRFIASGQAGENADVLVWDCESRALVYRLSEHDHGIACVAFSGDERLLCTVGVVEDGTMLIWDTSTGHIVTIAHLQATPVSCIAWGGMLKDIKRRDTADYQLATSGALRMHLWCLNPYTGDIRNERIEHEGRGSTQREITAMTFSEDEESLFCSSTSGDFLVVNVKRKQLKAAMPACRLGALSLLSWPGGVLVGGGDGTITMFDERMRDVAQGSVSGAVVALSFSPDRLEVVAGTELGFIYRVRLETMNHLLVSGNHCASVNCVAYAAGVSDRFATASADGSVRIWDASDYSIITTAAERGAGEPLCLDMSTDMLISGWRDGKIRSHDVDTGQGLWLIDNAHHGGVNVVTLSNNQRFMVTGGEGGEVRVWELRSRELVSHLKQHGQRVLALALYGDDVHVLSGSRDKSLICWDLRAEKQVSHHTQRMGGINAITLSSDQTMALTVGQEKRVTCWDLREHNPVTMRDLAPDLNDEAFSIAMSHSGRFFATGGSGMVVKLWGYESMELVASGKGHSDTITCVAFSPDDKQLVSTGADGCVLVWNIYA